MSETEQALRAALPGLDWTADDDEWAAVVFGLSYAILIPLDRGFYVKALGNAENCRTLPEAVAWLRSQIETVHARLGVALGVSANV